jgi:hypothetical protein
MPTSELPLSQQAVDAGSRAQGPMPADSIIAFAIARAMREYPELVERDLMKFIRRDTALVEENAELRRRLARLLDRGVPAAAR